MKKTNLLFIKIIFLGAILYVGFNFALAQFPNTPSLPATSANNIPGPINVGSLGQAKGGASIQDSLFNIVGRLSADALFVFRNSVFYQNVFLNLNPNGEKGVCVDSNGTFKICPEFTLRAVKTITNGGSGTVIANVAGISCTPGYGCNGNTINCGPGCVNPNYPNYGYSNTEVLASFNRPQIVTLTAIPSEGTDFMAWSSYPGTCPLNFDCNCSGSTNPICTVIVRRNQWVQAVFQVEIKTLSVTMNGIGYVSSTHTPRGNQSGEINCYQGSGYCSMNFDYNTAVTLTANSTNYGHAFLGWGGSCSGTNPVCTVTMNQARNVIANFAP